MEAYQDVTKAPHYFLVHFEERFTRIKNGTDPTGKPYVITCDNIPVNVYGFDSEEEVKAFDPMGLRKFLIGCHTRKEIWDAPNEDKLLQDVANDPRVKSGVYKLSEHTLYGAIENLPECIRMHVNKEGELLCGKGDSCFGGCVLQGFDQEEDMPNGFKCPLHVYWRERVQKKVTK